MTDDQPLRPGEVQKMFSISPRTLAHWVERGILTAMRLPSGHRRFDRAEVEALHRTMKGQNQ